MDAVNRVIEKQSFTGKVFESGHCVVQIVQMLIERGASPSAVNMYGPSHSLKILSCYLDRTLLLYCIVRPSCGSCSKNAGIHIHDSVCLIYLLFSSADPVPLCCVDQHG